MSYLWSTAAVAAAIVSGRLFSALAPLPNISMVFLMAVLFSAVSFGMWPAIYASVLSFLSYNFFFIEPLYTFQITQPHELLALIIFLIVAIVTSALAGRVRDQARAANERARTMRRLYEFTWKLSGLTHAGATADGAAGEIHTSLRRPAVILLNQDGELSLSAAWPPEDTLDSLTMEAARLAFARSEPVGCGSETLSNAQWYFIPLRTQSRSLGVVGIARDARGFAPDSEARALLATLAEQTAAALERSLLAQEMLIAQNTAETERVRNVLLASVSHDFRTPLASILGSATSLIEYRDRLDDDLQRGLLADIRTEAEGLDDMVRNLLAIARIDAGALELRRDWIDLREIAGRVVGNAKRRGADLSFVLDLAPELPMIAADAILIEQALANVVNNAVSHTPAGTRVVIDAVVTPQSISLRVTDNGPGIADEALPRVFDKFVRAGASKASGADKGEGTGLGLAITKGIVVAHGGSVRAESPVADRGGTRLTLTFPREQP
ncbi:MAG: two-component system, OmpR family, sensor histidine kinase KdpD [Burkholderiales bacterium]